MLRRGSEKAVSRRGLECPLGEHDLCCAHPINLSWDMNVLQMVSVLQIVSIYVNPSREKGHSGNLAIANQVT